MAWKSCKLSCIQLEKWSAKRHEAVPKLPSSRFQELVVWACRWQPERTVRFAGCWIAASHAPLPSWLHLRLWSQGWLQHMTIDESDVKIWTAFSSREKKNRSEIWMNDTCDGYILKIYMPRSFQAHPPWLSHGNQPSNAWSSREQTSSVAFP